MNCRRIPAGCDAAPAGAGAGRWSIADEEEPAGDTPADIGAGVEGVAGTWAMMQLRKKGCGLAGGERFPPVRRAGGGCFILSPTALPVKWRLMTPAPPQSDRPVAPGAPTPSPPAASRGVRQLVFLIFLALALLAIGVINQKVGTGIQPLSPRRIHSGRKIPHPPKAHGF